MNRKLCVLICTFSLTSQYFLRIYSQFRIAMIWTFQSSLLISSWIDFKSICWIVRWLNSGNQPFSAQPQRSKARESAVKVEVCGSGRTLEIDSREMEASKQLRLQQNVRNEVSWHHKCKILVNSVHVSMCSPNYWKVVQLLQVCCLDK